jgi:hypothetical protein
MNPPDPRRSDSPAVPIHGAAGEGPRTAAVDCEDGRTIELAAADLELVVNPAVATPDEIGSTIAGIPIRNQLAAARIAHAVSNAREARALIDEAVELLATVRGLHAETYQLGATCGALRDTIDALARHESSAGQGEAPTVDLKSDPSYEEIAIWLSFGIPVTS